MKYPEMHIIQKVVFWHVWQPVGQVLHFQVALSA